MVAYRGPRECFATGSVESLAKIHGGDERIYENGHVKAVYVAIWPHRSLPPPLFFSTAEPRRESKAKQGKAKRNKGSREYQRALVHQRAGVDGANSRQKTVKRFVRNTHRI